MHKSFIHVAALLAATTLTGTAQATDLIGETLSFLRAYPNTETGYGQPIADTTVAAGVGDRVTWDYFVNAPTPWLVIDPEADRIVFSLSAAGITGAAAPSSTAWWSAASTRSSSRSRCWTTPPAARCC